MSVVESRKPPPLKSSRAFAEQLTVVAESDPGVCLRSRLRDGGAVLTSLVLHATLLLILAICILPSVISQHMEVSATYDSGDGHMLDELVIEQEVASVEATEIETSILDLEVKSEIPEPEIELIRPNVVEKSEPTPSPPPMPEPATAPGTSADSQRAASSIEGAVDRVTSDIEEKLRNGDLLVVWLLDSSHSLVDDRQRVAARLEPFFERMKDADLEAQLQNAVVAFGATMKERVAPSRSGDRIVSSVKKLPIDASGKENVFEAIQKSVSRYRNKWREKQLMFVVWTDESGDDVEQLENTIEICRDASVSVSVVGPSSVLGADTGMHSYTDPKTRKVYQLPVKRGPDSAAPERLELGYWFGGQGRAPSWYGGSDLKGMVSGFSPYALTRLTLQTGGSYTIFDRDEDRGPFRPDAMREYVPDYRSSKAYLQDVQSHPLRQGVMEAVKVVQGKDLGPPEMMMFVKRLKSTQQLIRLYYPPTQFASKFRGMRRTFHRDANRTSRFVEQALAHVSEAGEIKTGMEYEYTREESKRWRAWYDLTRGRLLATSVRLEEFRLTCDQVAEPGFLNATTNHAIFLPGVDMKSDSNFRGLAKEAERLLMRCVSENEGTPWAYLAQRELAHGLGIRVQQLALTPTRGGSMSPTRQPNLPKF